MHVGVGETKNENSDRMRDIGGLYNNEIITKWNTNWVGAIRTLHEGFLVNLFRC